MSLGKMILNSAKTMSGKSGRHMMLRSIRLSGSQRFVALTLSILMCVGPNSGNALAGDETANLAAGTASHDVDFGRRREIVFVDGGVSDRKALLRALDLGDSNRSLEVIWLDPASDGMAQVTTALATRTGIDALHILSHGREGGFTIGAIFLDEREALRHAAELERWRASLRPGADLLVYGCRTARGSDGESLLRTLADLTGADVAGSEHLVGNSRSGGEWVLGVRVGRIETREAISEAGREAWPGLLAVLGYDSFSYAVGALSGNNGGTGWSDAWTFSGSGSIDVVATGLAHPTGGLVTAGGAVQLNAGALVPAQAVRNLNGSLGAVTETIWASFLIRPQDTGAVSYMGITLGSAGVPTSPDPTRLFVGYYGTNFNMNSWGHLTNDVNVPGVVIGQTAFLVLRLDISASGNETATLYVNPTAGLIAPDVPGSAPKSDLDLGTFSSISVAGGRGFAANPSQLDEVRLGNSYAEVAPSTTDCPGGVVTTTADSGSSSLRYCINFANVNPGTTITFNIPVPGNRNSGGDNWWAISPASALPTIIAASTVIDGTTQTTNQGNTNSRGPEVEIDGAGAGAAASGLVLGATAGGSAIRGLAIGNFSDNGILLLGGSNVVAGNYVGLSADGTTVAANNPTNVTYNGGIRIESASNTIGGTTAADRNVLSGNGFAGIELNGAGATGNLIYGNYIGVDASGTQDRGNEQEGIDLELAGGNTIGGPLAGQRNIASGNDSDGIEIDGGDNNVVQGNYIGTDVTGTLVIANGRDGIDINENGGDGAMTNLIGGTGANEGNLIRGNSIYGVQVRGAPASNNAILGNRIYGNVELDIDLNNDDITANDVLDADSGPNDLLNYPVIVAAPVSGGTITAYFALDVPAGDYRVEFFSNPSGAHADGNGGGEVFASATTITHAGAGVQYFVHTFAGSAGDVITATATERLAGPAYNSTSEFSAAVTATAFGPFTARWPLDETSGVTAAEIDAGNDGTYVNGVLLNQAAACLNTGNAVHFDGIDDYVEVPHSVDYLLDEGTVSLWINIDAIGAEQMIFSKDHLNFGTGGHLTLSVQPGGEIQARLQSTSASMYTTSAPVSAGVWNHVAFTWGPGGMAMYVNGAAPITDPYTGGLGVTSGGAGNFEPIAFGASTVISGVGVVTPLEDYFAGYMDDVRINNRALTQPEILTLASCAGSLDIVKRAFWPDGTPIPTGATIPSGVEFKYLLYVNNPGVARTDVTVRDVLDPAFLYQGGTIQVDNSLAECSAAICTPVEEQAIFAAVDAAAVLTDAADGDVASYTGASTSVDAGNGNVANLQLDINGSAVWAILFSAKMP